MSSSNKNFISQTEELLLRRKQAADQAMLGLKKGYDYTTPYYINDKSDIINTNKSKLSLNSQSQRFKNSYLNLKKDLLGEPKSINTNHNIFESYQNNRKANSNQLRNRIKTIYTTLQISPNKNKFSDDKNLNADQELLDCLLSEEELIKKYKNIKHHSINLSGVQKINNFIFYSSPDSKHKILSNNNSEQKKLYIQKINNNNFIIKSNDNTQITEIKELNTNNSKANIENKINFENKISVKNKINIENNKDKIEENFDNHKFYDASGIKDYTYTYEKYQKKSQTPNNSCIVKSRNFNLNIIDKAKSVEENDYPPIRADQRYLTDNNINDIQMIQNNSIKIDDRESFALVNQKSNNNIKNTDNMPLNTGISVITKDEIVSNSDKFEEERLNNINIHKNNFNKKKFNNVKNSSDNIKNKNQNSNNNCLISSIHIKNSLPKVQKIIDDDINYDLKNCDFEIFDSNKINNKLINFKNNNYFENKINHFNNENNKLKFNRENTTTERINKIHDSCFNNNTKFIIEKSTHAQQLLNELTKNNMNKNLKIEDAKYFKFRKGDKLNVIRKNIDGNQKLLTSSCDKNNIPDIRLISDNNGKEEIKIFDENEYKKIMGGDDTRDTKNFTNFIINFECEKKKRKKNYIGNKKEDFSLKNIYENKGKSLSGNKKYYNIRSMWVNNNNKIMPPNEIDYLYDLYKA